MNNEMTLSFVAIEENEALARMAMTCFITPLDPTLEEISEFKTIVSEAVTNAIIHGYECDGRSLVTLHATIDDHKVTMTVSDEGAGIADIERLWNRCLRRDRIWSGRVWDLRLWKAFPTVYLSNRIVGRGTVVKFEKTFSPVTETSRMR